MMTNHFKVFALSAILMGGFSAANAQVEDYPQNAEVGKCYAKCLIPDQYKTQTEQVQSKAASKKFQVVPAEYETKTEQMLVKEQAKKLIPVPAVYETVTEQMMVKEASTRLEFVAAVYETVKEQIESQPAYVKRSTVPPVYEAVEEKILVSDATTRWERGKKDPNCLSQNPEDCRVMCLVEVPAVYKTVSKNVIKTPATVVEEKIPAVFSTVEKRVVKTPATVKEVTIPAEYKTVSKQVLRSPATVREEVIPAEYKTITKRGVKTPEQVLEVEIPAEYQTVTKTVLVKKGGYTEWREVLCEAEVTVSKIVAIQQALKAKGYDPGPLDNVLGPKTRAALTQYQKDNALPVGRLDVETLKSLGVNR